MYYTGVGIHIYTRVRLTDTRCERVSVQCNAIQSKTHNMLYTCVRARVYICVRVCARQLDGSAQITGLARAYGNRLRGKS